MKRNRYLSLICARLLSACRGSPTASLSVTSMSFGNQAVGSVTAGAAITLSNTGSAGLRIDGIAVARPFIQGNTCVSSLAAGASCTINVTFAPTTEGLQQ
jgi:hypothetical protein